MKYRVLALLIALFLYYFTHHDIAHADGEVSTSEPTSSQTSSTANDSPKATPSLVGNIVNKTTSSVTDVVKDTVKGTTETVDKTVDNVANTVKDTTTQVSTTVDQVTTDVDQVVKDAVDLPAHVITEVDKAANGQSSDVLGSVTSSVDQTVNNVTGTVQNAVGNTTNTVTGVIDSTVQTASDAVTSVVDTTTTVIPDVVPAVPDVPVIHLPPIVPQLPVEVTPTPVPDDVTAPIPSKNTNSTTHPKKNSTQGNPATLPSSQPVQPAVPSVHKATESPSTEAVQSSTIHESNDKDPQGFIPSIQKGTTLNIPIVPQPVQPKVKSQYPASNITAVSLDDAVSTVSDLSDTDVVTTPTTVQPQSDSIPTLSGEQGTQPVSSTAAIWLDIKGIQGLIVAGSSNVIESSNSNTSNSQNVFVNNRLANWKHYRIHLLTYRAQSEHGSNQWTHAPPGQPPQEAPYFI
ncbi:hypothetical protein ACFSGI_14310 [Paenibacillus nicotianae]|uniref:Uncharacterized protein n=1 Tax=Paenibacillus nicotianae TaxID=1526551 RepID=A0ABW4UVY9_9BACL